MQASVAAWTPSRSSHQSMHGSLAHALEVRRGRRGRLAPAIAAAVPGGVLAAAPRARVPSRRAGGAASRSGRARRRACSARRSRGRRSTIRATQSKNASALADLADAAHRVRDEGAVAEPGEAVRRERRAGDVAAARRLAGADRLDAGAAGGQRDSMRAPMKDAGGRSSVLPSTVAIGPVVGDEPEPGPGRVAGGIRPHAGDAVVLDLAVRVVAAEDPDAERVRRPRCPRSSPIDISVIVIARSSVRLTRLSRTITIGEVRDDPLAARRRRCSRSTRLGAQVEGEGDVDPLRRRPPAASGSRSRGSRPGCGGR